MKIAVIGDSAVACLKEAVLKFPHLVDEHELIFFAGPGKSMEGLVVKNGLIAPDNDRLKKSLIITSGFSEGLIDPKDYDAFLLVGLGVDIRPLFQDYSSAVVKAANRGMVEGSICCEIIEKIKYFSDKPVYVAAAPLKALSDERFSDVYYKDVLSYKYQSDLVSKFFENIGVVFLNQPLETRNKEWITNRSLTKGSIRLIQGVPHPDEDVTHMNYEYGKLFLENFLCVLS